LSPALKTALTEANNLFVSLNEAIAAQSISVKDRKAFQREAEQEVMRFGGGMGVGNVVVRHLGKTYSGPPDQVIRQISNDLINREVQRRAGNTTAAVATSQAAQQITPLALLNPSGESKDKVDISKRLLDLNKQLIAAQDAEQLRLAATLELMVQKQEIAESNLMPLQKEDALNKAHFAFRQKIRGIDADIADQQQKDFAAQMKHQDELRSAIGEQKSQYEELNTTFRNGIVDSILAAVEGTKSLSDSLVGVLKQMARLILQQQLLNALSGFNLFGGGGGGFAPSVATSGTNFFGGGFSPIDFFANGGRPPVGRPSIVGERGPELFVPDRAGTIVPNHAMGGANVVVNVDASGSSAQGDGQQAKALGQAIGAAVQAELIKQKRPGGLLS